MSSADAVPVTFLSSHAGLGGSEAYLRSVLRRLEAAWVAGVVLLQNGPLAARLTDDGIPTRVVDVGTRPASVLRSAPALRSAVQSFPQRGRVVHANGVKAAIAGAVAIPTTPLLWVKHDHSFDGWRARLLACRCRSVLGVSESVLRTFPNSTRTAVVYNGIECDPADRVKARQSVQRLVGQQTRHTVALVGRFDPAKGHADLLEAVALAGRDGRTVDVLLIGGDDPAHPGYREEIAGLARRLNLVGQVHLLGHRQDVSTLIAGCDVVAVPSHAVTASGVGREGFGLVALEAMCAGTPVVGYADGATPEVVGSCGALVPPHDVLALARALERVWDDADERARMSSCGRDRAATFSIQRTVEQLCAWYRDAAS